jgi:peptidoglycan hydrolase-like protein with peptidoglycan-binding domain
MQPIYFLLALYSTAAFTADIAYWSAPVRDARTVAAAQQALRAEGYDPGPADGDINAKTVQAVKQAQKDRELEPTGRLDRRTAAALGVDVAENASAGASTRQERR